MAEPIRPTVVFDCNVYAQALINPNGPAGDAVRAAKRGDVRLVVSDHVLREVAELPPKLPARLAVTDARVAAFLVDLLTYAERVAFVPSVFTYDRDPDDAAYVDLAVAAGAGHIVTRDKDLLALSSDSAVGRDFAQRFATVRVVDPVSFLSLLATSGDGQ